MYIQAEMMLIREKKILRTRIDQFPRILLSDHENQ
jgi:hypothetical protein